MFSTSHISLRIKLDGKKKKKNFTTPPLSPNTHLGNGVSQRISRNEVSHGLDPPVEERGVDAGAVEPVPQGLPQVEAGSGAVEALLHEVSRRPQHRVGHHASRHGVPEAEFGR